MGQRSIRLPFASASPVTGCPSGTRARSSSRCRCTPTSACASSSKTKLADASVSRILIDRAAKRVNITIQTARPGIVIGKKGEDIEKLRAETAKMLKLPPTDVRLNIAEIRKPELDAQLVADGIAQQIEKRVMFRRAMKRAVMSTMRSGALGVKVRLSGRLNGSEIARTEWAREGRVPLHTFRADIDYGLGEARTTYGVIGVKVWIFKGEVFDKAELAAAGRERRSRAGCARAPPRAPPRCRGRRRRRRPPNEVIFMSMLQPKRTKYRKQFKGTNTGLAHRGSQVSFGEFGLKATSRARMTAREDRSGASRHDPLRRSAAARCGTACSPTCRSPRSRSKSAWARARATSSTGWRKCSPARFCSRSKVSMKPRRAKRSAWPAPSSRCPPCS